MIEPAVTMPAIHSSVCTIHLLIAGQVQGVGFRPFVYRQALRFQLSGWIRNQRGQVEIRAQGTPENLDRFVHMLLHQSPPLAQPELVSRSNAEPCSDSGFSILPSIDHGPAQIHVPPDYFMCNDCLLELRDPANHRYRYPFINCTQCGPRYTLIQRLPYDRNNTTMAQFPLCPECHREYQDPLNRRHHAEPIACPQCGPQLQFHDNKKTIRDTEKALAAGIAALRAGQIVAVKGIGGYHLLCDARSDAAVMQLRSRKFRPHKPLAVMFPADLNDLFDEVQLDDKQRKLLLSPQRPIVLIRKKSHHTLAASIAPGLNEIGVFLPYSPLHHLLLEEFAGPLLATSANISGEPVLTDNEEVENRLARVTHAFLHHNRPIQHAADDAVYRIINDRPRPLRLGRGNAPLEFTMPFTLRQPVLALGGHLKNTIALAWENRAVISPHLGDLQSPNSLMLFKQTITDLQSLYGIEAKIIVCDAHPGYASTRWAKKSHLDLIEVFHHHAHASAVAGEYPAEKNWLVFTWDGAGYGEDGTLWGGEALYGRPGDWQRTASFRPFRLPGGEKASREPWRSALALCWETQTSWVNASQDTALLLSAWQQGINCPQSSAAGRLFDAAAAFTGLIHDASFEGQGAMLLEASANLEHAEPLHLPIAQDQHGIWRTDWAPLLPLLLNQELPVAQRAACFHNTLATTLLEQACLIRKQYGEFAVGLSGGVFQNKRLTESAMALLENNGFRAYLPERVPCNDGGLSYGQIIEAGSRLNPEYNNILYK